MTAFAQQGGEDDLELAEFEALEHQIRKHMGTKRPSPPPPLQRSSVSTATALRNDGGKQAQTRESYYDDDGKDEKDDDGTATVALRSSTAMDVLQRVGFGGGADASSMRATSARSLGGTTASVLRHFMASEDLEQDEEADGGGGGGSRWQGTSAVFSPDGLRLNGAAGAEAAAAAPRDETLGVRSGARLPARQWDDGEQLDGDALVQPPRTASRPLGGDGRGGLPHNHGHGGQSFQPPLQSPSQAPGDDELELETAVSKLHCAALAISLLCARISSMSRLSSALWAGYGCQ
jgi:hypothetical protein